MRLATLLLLTATAPVSAQQWTQLVHPPIERCDDLYFLNADTGWAAGGGSGRILRTYDGGDSWSVVFEQPDIYLRSIEFLDAQVGFCGSLEGDLFRTTDGGSTWTEIMDLLPQPVAGVCGLSAAGPQTIYGTGAYFGHSHVIKSNDGGDTWQHIDMLPQAWCLVDVMFFNEQVGLVAGGAATDNTGASIFRTVDGGATWTEVFSTGTGYEWFWKLQSPDGVHVHASVQSLSSLQPHVARSSDAGQTWTLETISPLDAGLQGIGFVSQQEGWAGDQHLFHTTDGGETWVQVPPINGFNRLHRVNDQLAFAGGNGIFRYSTGGTGIPITAAQKPLERVEVSPNPAQGMARAEVHVYAGSWARIELRTQEGRLVQRLHNARIAAGDHVFQLDLSKLAPGSYLFILYTDQGATTTTVAKE